MNGKRLLEQSISTIETTAAAIGAATARSIFEVDGFFIVHQSSQNQVAQELSFED